MCERVCEERKERHFSKSLFQSQDVRSPSHLHFSPQLVFTSAFPYQLFKRLRVRAAFNKSQLCKEMSLFLDPRKTKPQMKDFSNPNWRCLHPPAQRRLLKLTYFAIYLFHLIQIQYMQTHSNPIVNLHGGVCVLLLLWWWWCFCLLLASCSC